MFICLFLFSAMVQSQDLEEIGKSTKVKFSGGLNISSQFYNVNGINARRSPFSWVINGNPVLRIGKMSFPFSFSFRDQRFGFGTPFNKFGVSPYYKWARVHIGWRSMNFSPYSMSGRSFLGFGAELKPGKLRASGFIGTIRNPLAQRDTIVYGAALIPTYKRRAYGFKLGYGSSRNYIDLIYFKAKDDVNAPPVTDEVIIPDIELDPAENLVLGTSFRLTLFRKFIFTSNLSVSAYADNSTHESIKLANGVYRFFDNFFDPNVSTQVSFAGDAHARINLKKVQLGVRYRRVEPHFRSLGITYIQSDVESVTTTASMHMLKRRLRFNGQLGLERTNLRNYDYVGRRRVIGSIRAQFVPQPEIMVMGQYSNYQYETQDGLVELNDTLRFVSVTQNSGLFFNYNKQKGKMRYGVNFNAQLQSVKDQSPIARLGNDIQSLLGGLSVNLEWESLQLRLRPSVHYSRYLLPQLKQERYGFGLNVRKGFLDDKLSLSLYSRYAYNDVNERNNGTVWTSRANIDFRITDAHTIQLSSTWMKRNSIISPSYDEWRSRVSYGMRF